MITVNQIQCGQSKPYGDFFRIWEIKTDMSKEDSLSWCFENIYKRKVPEYGEWRKNTVLGGEKYGDLGYYFAGYYTIKSHENGYMFTICEPYCD
jgi:hypothetical protein